LQIFIFIL